MWLFDRSPKDGDPYEKEKILEEYKYNLEKLSKELNKDINDNNITITAMDKTHILIVKNGKDELNWLLTNAINHNDILECINYGGKEQIALREWNNELSTDYEFRTFIYNNKITAFQNMIIMSFFHIFWRKR